MSPESNWEDRWKLIVAALRRGFGPSTPVLLAATTLFASYPEEMIRGAIGVVVTLFIARQLR